MKVIIVEDEISATENMQAILKDIDARIDIAACLESVKDASRWIDNHPPPDLAFFDIQLADGSSFEIFEKTNVKFPVVFTTAYNEYALRAFKVNSIDYILKPIKKADIEFAIRKYQELDRTLQPSADRQVIAALQEIRSRLADTWKKTLLIRKYDGFRPVSVCEFAFFIIDNGTVRGMAFSKEQMHINETLDALENLLSPNDFFRASRQAIVARKAVKEVSNYFNGRLLIKTTPEAQEQIIVSKARAGQFKQWLEG